MIHPLIVNLWGREVGRLHWNPRKGNTYFQFNQEYLQSGWDIAPLLAPLSRQDCWSTYLGEEERMYSHLPAFIADSLPDAWGNQLFDLWVEEQGIMPTSITPLEKLAFIGKRGMGALEFEPSTDRILALEKIDVASLHSLAQRIFREREDVAIFPEDDLSLQALFEVGTSAGGRQPKAVIAMNAEGEIRSGQIAGLEGFDYYILKFGNAARSTAELEYAYYQMAIRAGINMMECRLIEIEGEKHFLTKRYDRVNGQKMHTQTLSAIDPEVRSYEGLMFTCRRLKLTETEIQEMYRRTVFNHLTNNTDDHIKNFSFMMDPSGRWQITPAYDLTYIFDLKGYTPYREHCLTLRSKVKGHTLEDLIDFGHDCGIPRPKDIIKQVADAVADFRRLAREAGVLPEWIGRVEQTLRENLAAWGFGEKEPTRCVTESVTIGEQTATNLRLEQAYKGNYHLYATLDGRERRFVIRQKTELHHLIASYGMQALTMEQLRGILTYFLR